MALDWDTAKTVGGVFSAGIVALGGIVYRSTTARIAVLEAQQQTKADVSELVRTRDHLIKCFEENGRLREDMMNEFASVRTEMHDMHLDIIDRLPLKG